MLQHWIFSSVALQVQTGMLQQHSAFKQAACFIFFISKVTTVCYTQENVTKFEGDVLKYFALPIKEQKKKENFQTQRLLACSSEVICA